jgi:hypothetical protein
MDVQYISISTNEILVEINTDDIAGVLAAVKSGEIAFLDGVRNYESHMLCFYKQENHFKQYIKIFVK